MNDISLHIGTLAAIASIQGIVLVTPGPNFLLMLHVSNQSRPAIWAAASGISSVTLIWSSLGVFGLGALLAQSALFYEVFRWLGGGYLIWLGLSFWIKAKPSAPSLPVPVLQHRYWYIAGFITNITNPKSIAFFASIYAITFTIDTPWSVRLTAIPLAGLLAFVWHVFLGFALSTAAVRNAYQRFRLWLDRLVGGIMIAFGLRLLWSN